MKHLYRFLKEFIGPVFPSGSSTTCGWIIYLGYELTLHFLSLHFTKKHARAESDRMQACDLDVLLGVSAHATMCSPHRVKHGPQCKRGINSISHKLGLHVITRLSLLMCLRAALLGLFTLHQTTTSPSPIVGLCAARQVSIPTALLGLLTLHQTTLTPSANVDLCLYRPWLSVTRRVSPTWELLKVVLLTSRYSMKAKVAASFVATFLAVVQRL
jgi:hypothetical protein